MFARLTDFKYVRTTKEAVGFYIAYLFLYLLIGAISGMIVSGFVGAGFDGGLTVGKYGALIATIVLVYLLLKYKKLFKSFPYLLISIVTIGLAYLGGGLLGLIPVAFLTTRKPLK